MGFFIGKSFLCERKGGMSCLWNPSMWYLEYQCHLPGFLCYLGPVLGVLSPHLDQFVPKSLFRVTSSPNPLIPCALAFLTFLISWDVFC